MSLIFTDSFAGNDINVGKYDVNSGAVSAFDGGARSNGYLGYSNGSNARTLTKSVPATEENATFIAGQAIKSASGLMDVFAFLSDTRTTTHVTITITPGASGTVKAYRGTSAGTLLGTYTGSVLPSGGSWYYIEAKVTLGGSGAVDILLDGVNILSLAGVNTQNGGTKTVFDSMSWKLGNSTAQTMISDVYLCNGAGSKNNDFLIAPKIIWLNPNGNGSSSQGVGSDGNSTDNYLLVDEPLGSGPSTADYIDLNNTGDKDLYAFANTPVDIPGVNEVHGVMAWSYARKNDASARSLIHVARSGASEIDSTSALLLDSVYSWVKGAIENKPGGGAWTVTDLNAMEFGIKAGA